MKTSNQLLIFGQRLKALRNAAGYTQKEMYKKIRGYEPSDCKTYGSWERGQTLPCIEDLLNICDILNCDTDYLLGRINEISHENKYIYDKLGLSEKSIKAIKGLVKTNEVDEMLLALTTGKEHIKQEHAMKEASNELFILNRLLESSIMIDLLSNLYEYFFIEYDDINDSGKKKFVEFFKKEPPFPIIPARTRDRFENRTAIPFIKSDYLNDAFLLSITNNLKTLKEEYFKSEKRE